MRPAPSIWGFNSTMIFCFLKFYVMCPTGINLFGIAHVIVEFFRLQEHEQCDYIYKIVRKFYPQKYPVKANIFWTPLFGKFNGFFLIFLAISMVFKYASTMNNCIRKFGNCLFVARKICDYLKGYNSSTSLWAKFQFYTFFCNRFRV